MTLALALPASACGAPGDEVVQITAQQRGEQLFADPALSKNSYNRASCATCHATSAEDPRVLAGAPLDGVIARATYWGGETPDLREAIDLCLRFFMLDSAGIDPSSTQGRDLYAYLASLPARATDEQPFTVVRGIDDLPKGDATRGAARYAATCQPCHGARSSGQGRLMSNATPIPDGTRAEHCDDYGPLEVRKTAIEKVRHGGFLGYGGQMPPFSREVLPDEALADILSYVGFDLDSPPCP